MLKQLVLGMAIATAASASFAAETNDCFSGLYVGAGVKYANSVDKLKTGVMDLLAENPGFAGNLFLGYGRVLNSQVYLGGEAYGDLGYRRQFIGTTNSDLTIKTKYQLGLMAKVGYVVTPQTLVYVGLGAENAKFNLGTEEASKNYNKWAFAPSVGMDLALNSNLQVGARYTYSNYRDINLGDSVTYKPARNTLGLNLTYRFASL